MKVDEMQTLASVVDSMHKLAEGLETLAIYLLRDVGEQQSAADSRVKPAAETATTASKVTLEEVRGVLAEKSAAGHTAKVRQLLKDLGADKLSAVKPEDYATLKASAEVL